MVIKCVCDELGKQTKGTFIVQCILHSISVLDRCWQQAPTLDLTLNSSLTVKLKYVRVPRTAPSLSIYFYIFFLKKGFFKSMYPWSSTCMHQIQYSSYERAILLCFDKTMALTCSRQYCHACCEEIDKFIFHQI